MLPKHELVAAALRRDILEGRIRPSEQLASEGELCERFEASRGPVRQGLATLEREGLIYRIQGAGSFVSEGVSEDPTARRRRITVVLGFEGEVVGVGAELINWLNRARKEVAERALLSFEFGFDNFDRFCKASPASVHAECDGLLVLPVSESDMELTRQIDARRVPVVGCFRRVEGANIPQVYIDQDEGSLRATEYLLCYGHRRIGLITARGEDGRMRYDAAHRINGYRSAYAGMGLKVDESMIVESSWSMDVVGEVVSRLLSMPNRPTALMIGGIMLLNPVIVALRELGLRVPDDISIVAFDDSEQAKFHAPPLTIVSQCADKVARGALKLLMGRIIGGATDSSLESVPVRPELIIRDSCRPVSQ